MKPSTSDLVDYLVMLLSTDWFLPYWGTIGINVVETKKVAIQEGCREIVDQMLEGENNYFLTDLSEERKRKTRVAFVGLLQACGAEVHVWTTLNEWAGLSSKDITAALDCADLNSSLTLMDATCGVPNLEFSIRAEVMRTWEAYKVGPSILRDACVNSGTDWDIRSQRLLSNPRALVNRLWAVLVDRRLREFWVDLRARLRPEQRQELLRWYRAAIKSRCHEDRPDLIPSYIN